MCELFYRSLVFNEHYKYCWWCFTEWQVVLAVLPQGGYMTLLGLMLPDVVVARAVAILAVQESEKRCSFRKKRGEQSRDHETAAAGVASSLLQEERLCKLS